MTDQNDPRGQYLVLASAYCVRISARPDNGINVLAENEHGEIVLQARYIASWRYLQIIMTERIDP